MPLLALSTYVLFILLMQSVNGKKNKFYFFTNIIYCFTCFVMFGTVIVILTSIYTPLQSHTPHKKWSFPIRIFSVNVTKSAAADLVTSTEEILIRKLHFLCSALLWFTLSSKDDWERMINRNRSNIDQKL